MTVPETLGGERGSRSARSDAPREQALERAPVDERMHEYEALAAASEGVSRIRRLQASADDFSATTSAAALGRIAQFDGQGAPASASVSASGHAEPATRGGGLPPKLQRGVESLAGVSMAGVDVHYDSPEPARMNAYAFARGSTIHLGPGRASCLPHEAWHVAQQRQGRVAPTRVLGFRPFGGPGSQAINDDQALEREADLMGAKAAARGEALSASMERAGAYEGTKDGATEPALRRPAAPDGAVVQRMARDRVEAAFGDMSHRGKKLKELLSDPVYAAIVSVTTAYDKGDPDRIAGVQSELGDIVLDVLIEDPDEVDDVAYWTARAHQAIKKFDKKYETPEEKAKKEAARKEREARARQAAQAEAGDAPVRMSAWDASFDATSSAVDTSDVDETLAQYGKLGNGWNDRKERIVLECAMAQGVSGDLRKYMLYSAGFGSCTPVILWNGGTQAGLFHYAEGRMKQLPTLLALCRRVGTTHAWIGQEDPDAEPYGDAATLRDVLLRIDRRIHVDIFRKKGQAFVYLDDNGVLQRINDVRRGSGYVDLTGSSTRRDDWRNMDFGFEAYQDEMRPNLFPASYKADLKYEIPRL